MSAARHPSIPTSTPDALPVYNPPAIPPIHTISLDGYQASMVIPGNDGLALDPAADPGFVGKPSLAFYRYATRQVSQIATAPIEPDGAAGGILGLSYAGSWISYVTAGPQQTNWALWAYDVETGERIQVDSEARERPTGPWRGDWMASQTDLVWSVLTLNPATSQSSSKLLDFAYATRQSRMLYFSPDHTVAPIAISDDTVVFSRLDTANGTTGATWILRSGQSTPTKLVDQLPGSASMNSGYLVWDDAHTESTTLYDLASGTELQNWAPCIRPVIDTTRPYVVCLSYDARAWVLVHVPDGDATQFFSGLADVGSGGAVYDGRVVWVASTAQQEYADAVDYFDLPAQ